MQHFAVITGFNAIAYAKNTLHGGVCFIIAISNISVASNSISETPQ